MNTNIISDYELYLYFGYVPKFREANLEWLLYDPNNNFGDGVNDEVVVDQ